mmetsp:Transcript_9432/g.15628  ORF Transcript_9432/g.15628 Transcript_9432/m.15628 type:complete len:145 (+) Transcript_9432:156-590(+)
MVSIKKKITKVFKKKDSAKKEEAAVEVAAEPSAPQAPTPPTYDALIEARENDEANVSMPKDDIRDEEGMVVVEDVTDMEEHLSVVEEGLTNEEQEEVEEETNSQGVSEIVAPATPAPQETKVVDEAPAPSPGFLCGITNCLGRD